MVSRNTWNRLRKYGIIRLLSSVDILLPAAIIALSWKFNLVQLNSEQVDQLLSSSAAISGTFIGVVLTGIAIVVALSDEQFLEFINNSEDIYDRLLFIFEYTVLLAIVVSVVSVYLRVFGSSAIELYIYIFLFGHMVFSVFRLVSLLITYGKKKAQYTAIDNIDSDDVELDIPDKYKQGTEVETEEVEE